MVKGYILNDLRGKSFDCECGRNPHCVKCGGSGIFRFPWENANEKINFIPRTGKIGVSPFERFMEMESSILPNTIVVWITDKFSNPSSFRIFQNMCGDNFYQLFNNSDKVFDVLKNTLAEILDRVDFEKGMELLNKNKNLTIKIEIPDNIEPYPIGSFNYEDEISIQTLLIKIIEFFKTQFMPDIFES